MSDGHGMTGRIPADMLSLADYAGAAGERLSPAVRAWLENGSGGEQALRANATAFDAYHIANRLLVDCRHGSTATMVLGHRLAHPVLLAPIGFQQLVHPQGEVAMAAGALDTVMIASSMASTPLEEIGAAAAGPFWFQLYLQPERRQTSALLRRAEAAGATAIMVTLDVPVKPLSLAAQKAGFRLPEAVEAVNLRGFLPDAPVTVPPGESMILRGMMRYAPLPDDLRWLRQQTSLPIIAKGVTHRDDATQLLALGMDALAVSNHGGRALECAPPALHMLPGIRAAVGPDVPLLLDGGIRCGADVLKALALGANAVMIGRPAMHGLAVAGSLGVAHLLQLLRDDLALVMALAGAPAIGDIGPHMLLPAGAIPC